MNYKMFVRCSHVLGSRKQKSFYSIGKLTIKMKIKLMRLDFMKDIFFLHKMNDNNYLLLGVPGNKFVTLTRQS